MPNKSIIEWCLIAIGFITFVTGASQIFFPTFLLSITQTEINTVSIHFFATEGMFMVLFGGLLIHAMLTPGIHVLAVFWTGLQKLGATIAVTIGIINGVFAMLISLVAIFDLISCILLFVYWSSIRK